MEMLDFINTDFAILMPASIVYTYMLYAPYTVFGIGTESGKWIEIVGSKCIINTMITHNLVRSVLCVQASAAHFWDTPRRTHAARTAVRGLPHTTATRTKSYTFI